MTNNYWEKHVYIVAYFSVIESSKWPIMVNSPIPLTKIIHNAPMTPFIRLSYKYASENKNKILFIPYSLIEFLRISIPKPWKNGIKTQQQLVEIHNHCNFTNHILNTLHHQKVYMGWITPWYVTYANYNILTPKANEYKFTNK